MVILKNYKKNLKIVKNIKNLENVPKKIRMENRIQIISAPIETIDRGDIRPQSLQLNWPEPLEMVIA